MVLLLEDGRVELHCFMSKNDSKAKWTYGQKQAGHICSHMICSTMHTPAPNIRIAERENRASKKVHPFGGGVSPIWDVLYIFGLIFLPVKTVLVTLFGGFGLYYNTYSLRSETLFTLDSTENRYCIICSIVLLVK